MATAPQPTKTPTRKLLFAMIGSVVVAAAAAIVTISASVHIPPDVLVAAQFVGAFLPAYLAKETVTQQ